MAAAEKERETVLPLLQDNAPELHIAHLSRFWGLSQRVIRRWVRLGMLPGRQRTPGHNGGPYWFAREDIEAFARAAIYVRDVKPGHIIRDDAWNDGLPSLVIEISDGVNGSGWRLGGRPTDGGAPGHTASCRGNRIVLLVPPESER
jgi:hypothetical protein